MTLAKAYKAVNTQNKNRKLNSSTIICILNCSLSVFLFLCVKDKVEKKRSLHFYFVIFDFTGGLLTKFAYSLHYSSAILSLWPKKLYMLQLKTPSFNFSSVTLLGYQCFTCSPILNKSLGEDKADILNIKTNFQDFSL